LVPEYQTPPKGFLTAFRYAAWPSSSGHLGMARAEAPRFGGKSPSSFWARTPPAASFPSKLAPWSSASPGATYFPATNSLPAKSSHCVFSIRIAKPKFLVGSLGEEPRGYVDGVTFCGPELDFWQIGFPPPEQPSQPPQHGARICHLRRTQPGRAIRS
jgi:hypothetical protein